MKYQKPVFQPMGERAILVSWKPIIAEDQLEFIIFTKERIQLHKHKSIVEVIHTYNSLLIKYRLGIKNIYGEILSLEQLISTVDPSKKSTTNLYHLPVCYDRKFGLDSAFLAKEKGLDFSAIQQLHCAPIYTIYFMGFLPGFLYLGGLDKRLFLDRKKTPRKRLEKGAVGIGGKQTGIYPKASPGGWQIIGNCPVSFFDSRQDPPSIFRPLDKIKFFPVSVEEHTAIRNKVQAGTYELKIEQYGA